MTLAHLILLVLGVVAAIVAADLLGHAGIGAWPIGLLVVALVGVTGWFYSGNLAAITLGLALGFCIVSGRDLVRSARRRRALRAGARREADDLRNRKLGGQPASAPRFLRVPRRRS